MPDMTTKRCRDCEREFKRSPADSTVRCPACRASGRAPAARAATYAPVACAMCGHVHTTLKCDRCGF